MEDLYALTYMTGKYHCEGLSREMKWPNLDHISGYRAGAGFQWEKSQSLGIVKSQFQGGFNEHSAYKME